MKTLIRVLALMSLFAASCAEAETSFPSETLAADLIPHYTNRDGNDCWWEVTDDVDPTRFEVRDLEFVSYLSNGQESGFGITGEAMREQAVWLRANFGLVDAKYILAHQDEIPAEWQGNIYIVFPGTLLRDFDGNINVAYSAWDGKLWRLYFTWLADRWNEYGRLARPSSP